MTMSPATRSPGSLWESCKLPVVSADVHQWMCAWVTATRSSPGRRPSRSRWSQRRTRARSITHHDPLTEDVVEALKLYRDDLAGSTSPTSTCPARSGSPPVHGRISQRVHRQRHVTFKAADWDWDEERSGPICRPGFEDVMPVVRFRNRDGVGEFERHIDVLDRINRSLLRGLVVMTYQAFKQRAVTGDLPEKDEAGNLINYQELLKAGPDALWLLPPDVKISGNPVRSRSTRSSTSPRTTCCSWPRSPGPR
jgi:hypothetical protein